jgi:transcription elongation factor Elf1
MASEKAVVIMLESMKGLWPNFGGESVKQYFLSSLKDCTDKDVAYAAKEYVKTAEYPPRPSNLLKIIESTKADTKHREALERRFKCSTCGKKTSSISNGMCFDCAGIPDVAPSPLGNRSSGKDSFIIRERGTCEECGRQGKVIKEPADNGVWLCQICYSGLSSKQVALRFRHLQMIMQGGVSKNKPFPDEEISMEPPI